MFYKVHCIRHDALFIIQFREDKQEKIHGKLNNSNKLLMDSSFEQVNHNNRHVVNSKQNLFFVVLYKIALI